MINSLCHLEGAQFLNGLLSLMQIGLWVTRIHKGILENSLNYLQNLEVAGHWNSPWMTQDPSNSDIWGSFLETEKHPLAISYESLLAEIVSSVFLDPLHFELNKLYLLVKILWYAIKLQKKRTEIIPTMTLLMCVWQLGLGLRMCASYLCEGFVCLQLSTLEYKPPFSAPHWSASSAKCFKSENI